MIVYQIDIDGILALERMQAKPRWRYPVRTNLLLLMIFRTGGFPAPPAPERA
ncbi:hypothetical protein BH10PSE6_BH10PSE6_59940 [soil metagenome]